MKSNYLLYKKKGRTSMKKIGAHFPSRKFGVIKTSTFTTAPLANEYGSGWATVFSISGLMSENYEEIFKISVLQYYRNKRLTEKMKQYSNFTKK